MPIRARIALFCAIVVCFSVLAFGVGLCTLSNNNAYSKIDGGLTSRGHQLAAGIQRSGMPDPNAPDLKVDGSDSTDSFLGVADANGATLWFRFFGYGRGIDSVPETALRAATLHGSALVTVSPRPNDPVRLYVQPIAGQDRWSYVVAGQPLVPTRQNLDGLNAFIFIVAGITLLAALGATWLVAGPALRPLRQMASAAEEIGRTQDLARRLPDVRSQDELGRLSHAFNDMLARLQAAVESQRRFVADASHELRTPLTSVSSNASLLLRHPELDPSERAAALRDMEAESARMTRLVQDLLTLARADGGQRLEKAPTSLDEVASNVLRQTRRLHPELRIEADISPVQAAVNRDAMTQLTWILVDNAAKHARSQVRLDLARANGTVRLGVADDGPGVPAADAAHIFERFYQADPSRHQGGAGLGLAIARWVAEQHGGTLEVRNQADGGARFELVLPG